MLEIRSITMNRCKNWFCARSNNNEYSNVAVNEQARAAQNAANAAAAASALAAKKHALNGLNGGIPGIHNSSHHLSNNNNSQNIVEQQPAATAANNQHQHQQQQQQQPQQQHVVTFLDDVPSGSNGVVSTTSRLITQAELHQQQQQHQQQHQQQQQQQQQQQSIVKHSNLDTIDAYDDMDAGQSLTTFCDDSTPPAKNCYRLVMLGSSRVGKSSIVARFLGNRFEEAYTPTIEEFHRKLYRIRNEVFQLDILDTSGHHPFPAMRRLSFMTGDLFILAFSMDSRESFEEVVRLRENILETKWTALNPGSGFKKKSLPKIPMILAGNKCDREFKAVQLDEVMGYIAGQDNCCTFVECSAKQNLHIDDLFYALFMVSNLPLEMAPNHHRRLVSVFGAPSPLPPHSTAGGSKKNALSIKRRFSDACGVVTPNARRPSIRTDLNLMRSKTMAMNEGDGTRSARRHRCCIM